MSHFLRKTVSNQPQIIKSKSSFTTQQSQIQCYLLRHAESKFNEYTRLMKLSHTMETHQKNPYYLDPKLIDCEITENGIKQIQNLQFPYGMSTSDIFFDIIFVSPMNRTLQTTKLTLEKHKIAYNKIYVLAGLTQVMKNVCDFGNCLQNKKQKYVGFDFSLIDTQDTGKQNIKYWQDDIIDEKYRYQIDLSKNNGERYIKTLQKIYPQSLQSTQRCLERSKKALKQIRAISLQQNAKKILIISHNRILKNIITDGIQQNLTNFKIMDNCEIRKSKI